MNTKKLYEIFGKYPKISTDTRTLTGNSIFFAIKGENFDANKMVYKAFENGAKYVVTDAEENKNIKNCIFVENTLTALQNLANYHRKKLNIPLIGITGTNGKTTTKELTAAVLSKKYNVGFTQGNLNNHIGVPLTILTFGKNTQIAIVEMGANQINEIKELCEIALPDFGIITNIGKAHLQGFNSIEGVIKAKKELYNSVEQKNGTIFYNSDNEILKNILPNTKLITYGLNENNYCSGKIIEKNILLEMDLKTEQGNYFNVKTKLYGNYNYENILAATTVGNFFGVADNEIKDALENYTPSNNRSQISKTNKNTLILDAYNANPSSMEKSLYTFIKSNLTDKIIILGDMLELGNQSEAEHKKILEIILKNENKFNKIILVGTEFKKSAETNELNSKFVSFENSEQAAQEIKKINITNSNILIKGSRGIKLEKVADEL